MGARTTVRLGRASGETLKVSALLNGGFESREPCVLIPRKAAERLFPNLPAGTTQETVMTAGGPSTVRVTNELLEARIVTRQREGPTARVRGLVSETETELLVSDTAIDRLGVKIESHGKGLWRFADEKRIRRRVRRQDW